MSRFAAHSGFGDLVEYLLAKGADPNLAEAGFTALQIAIKHIGTNGGGFFNVNSAHPLENPTPLSNFLQVLAILLIPAALCYTFGEMVSAAALSPPN